MLELDLVNIWSRDAQNYEGKKNLTMDFEGCVGSKGHPQRASKGRLLISDHLSVSLSVGAYEDCATVGVRGGLGGVRHRHLPGWYLNPQPLNLNPTPSSLSPQPSTLNPHPSTLNPQP